ncbi:MAG: CpsD/CapB family tyrosine-protein kinase [Gammaproteobacteria bacterium]
MSLIEEAIRKATFERTAGRGNLARQPRVARAVPNPAIAEASARQFALAPPDPEAMERHHVLLGLSDVAVSRAYKILRTRVLQRMRAKGWNSIGITGTAAGEGKSLTALNLALALAQDVNTWVFLVDLDLQRPQIGSYLGMRYERGLTDYLTGHAEIDQIIYDTGVKRLAVIPNAHPVEQSSEYISAPRMTELMAALDAETPRRIVVYDMPPLLVSDDVLAFAPRLDSLLLVVSQGQTARRTLANAREILSEMNLIGVVLNRSTERNDSPYY